MGDSIIDNRGTDLVICIPGESGCKIHKSSSYRPKQTVIWVSGKDCATTQKTSVWDRKVAWLACNDPCVIPKG